MDKSDSFTAIEADNIRPKFNDTIHVGPAATVSTIPSVDVIPNPGPTTIQITDERSGGYYIADTTSGGTVTYELPAASECIGRTWTIIKATTGGQVNISTTETGVFIVGPGLEGGFADNANGTSHKTVSLIGGTSGGHMCTVRGLTPTLIHTFSIGPSGGSLGYST